LPAGLLVVAAVLAFLTFRPMDNPKPTPSIAPSPTQTADEHSIQVGDATLSFTLANSALVIAETRGGATRELARVPVDG
jgi:hypothetical protein